MILAVLHPGEMGISVAAAAISSGHRVLWVSEGRSLETNRRAALQNLEDVGTLSAIHRSDMIFFYLSATSCYSNGKGCCRNWV